MTIASARTITLTLEFEQLKYAALDPYYSGQTYYTVNVLVSSDVNLGTNVDQVNSPGNNPAFGGSESGYGYSLFGDFASAVNAATNGLWTLTTTNGATYTFTVSANPNAGAITFPTVQINTPADGSQSVSTNTPFNWSGPAAWSELDLADHDLDYSFYDVDSPDPTATNWDDAPSLPLGTNFFEVTYKTNAVAWFTISVPVDNLSHPFTNWVSATKLSDFVQSEFVTVTNPFAISTGHTLIAHYTFDGDENNLGVDSSPNDNNIGAYDYSYWGQIQTNNADAETGAGAIQFFGTSCLTPENQVLTNFYNVLAGSFTFSGWVKTTAAQGNDGDDAVNGATVFWAYNDHNNTNDTIPLAITGSKAAFSTRDHLGNSSTIHSATSVNDGNYHLITVTRNQRTGEKRIYVDGNFEASEFGTTDPLNGNNYFLSIGGTTISSYTGLLDDLQIYSGVLSPTEVATLYNNAGTTIPDVAGSAAAGLIVHYDFDEGTTFAPDVSGRGNNIIVASNIDDYDGDNPLISTDSIAGAGSVGFDGYSFLAPPTNLLSTIAGTFSLSLWVKTTDNSSYPGDIAWNGACIVSADVPSSLVNGDIIPVALTGGQVAFNTGSPQNGDDTINSQALVNDGQWHHIVVMRNQPTGEKDIYIDGVLDTSDFDTTNLLNDPQILTIGCKADASNPDPASPSYTGSDGYTGLVDDIQLYNRILSPNEVSYLYNNPGATTGSSTFTPYPVDVSLQLTIQRSQDPNLGQYFSAGVSFNSVSPAATTTNSVYSPNGYFNTQNYPSGGSGSSTILSSLGDVLNEITNGNWKIYINQGSPTQEVYSFQVSVSGLNTNLLAATTIFSPTNGSINVLPNASFYWNGPTNFSTLNVGLFTGPDTDIGLPLTATNWTPSQAMTNGSQTFFVSYNSNNFPNVTFTTPVDASSNPIDSWNATALLNSEAFASFVVYGPTSVQLLNLKDTSGNFNFSFTSQTGFTNSVQYRTNLVVGSWQTYSKITGDGTVKNVSVPISVFNGSKQGFVRVSTQ